MNATSTSAISYWVSLFPRFLQKVSPKMGDICGSFIGSFIERLKWSFEEKIVLRGCCKFAGRV